MISTCRFSVTCLPIINLTLNLNSEPPYTFKGWKVALLLNLTHTKEQDEINARFELDFGSQLLFTHILRHRLTARQVARF